MNSPNHSVVAGQLAQDSPEPGYTRCFIGLGSNLNEPVHQLQSACLALDNLTASYLQCCSQFYVSQPMLAPGQTEPQADYINAVVALDTRLSASTLMQALLEIEATHGRIRTEQRWASRTLDLDLLLYGTETMAEPMLTVPHPGLAEREFVLYPLYEIAPHLMLPDGTAVRELVQHCPRRGLLTLEQVRESTES